MITQEQLKRLNRIYEISNEEEVRRLIEEVIALETNASKIKESNFNIYDFASKDKSSYQEVMTGVYHEEGWRVASDLHILIAIKDEYDEKCEGKVLRVDGSEIDTTSVGVKRYPKWKTVHPSYKDTISYKIDFSKLEEWMKIYKVHHKMMAAGERKRHTEYVQIGKSYYSLKLLYTFAKGMKYLGADSLIQSIEKDGEKMPGFVETEKGWAVIMPIMNTNKGGENKDEQYNVYEF